MLGSLLQNHYLQGDIVRLWPWTWYPPTIFLKVEHGGFWCWEGWKVSKEKMLGLDLGLRV